MGADAGNSGTEEICRSKSNFWAQWIMILELCDFVITYERTGKGFSDET